MGIGKEVSSLLIKLVDPGFQAARPLQHFIAEFLQPAPQGAFIRAGIYSGEIAAIE
jgi:hypothetical protein